MQKLVIVGGQRLEGTIRVSGAKNAALPILAACMLSSGTCRIGEVPHLDDVRVMLSLLEYLGARVEWVGDQVCIDNSGVKPLEVTEELMRKMRASNLIMGALLSRFGFVKVSQPGGCDPI